MRTYEVMTIHRPELADTDVETHVGELRTFPRGEGRNGHRYRHVGETPSRL